MVQKRKAEVVARVETEQHVPNRKYAWWHGCLHAQCTCEAGLGRLAQRLVVMG